MYLLMIHVRHIALTDEGQDGICLRSFAMETWGILSNQANTQEDQSDPCHCLNACNVAGTQHEYSKQQNHGMMF